MAVGDLVGGARNGGVRPRPSRYDPSHMNFACTPVLREDVDDGELVAHLTDIYQQIKEMRRHMDLPKLDQSLGSGVLKAARELFAKADQRSQGFVTYAELKQAIQASEDAKTILLPGDRGWEDLLRVLPPQSRECIRLHDFVQLYVLENCTQSASRSMESGCPKTASKKSSTLRGESPASKSRSSMP